MKNLILTNYGTITDCKNNITWSSAQISERVNKIIKKMITLGFKKKNNVFLKHSELPDFFCQILAIWSLGGSVSCLNPKITEIELNNLISFMSPKFIIDQNKIECLNSFDTEGLEELKSGFSIDQPALILFTSGTTGTPKAVVHSFRSILSRVSLNVKYIGVSNLENTLCLLPMHFGHGLIGNSLTAFLSGKNLFILENNLTNLSNIEEHIKENSITFLSSVPSMWKTITKLTYRMKKRILRKVHIGSAPLSADLWNEVIDWGQGCEVVNMYGITETANWFSGASSLNYKPIDGLVGTPWGGQAGILSKDTISHSGEGEIVLLTPSIMLFYYKQQALTEKAFFNNWYRTGDTGIIDNDTIQIKGRIKNEINRGGLKVIPEDIDILLEKNPIINEACTFGTKDEILGEKVCVAVVIKKGKAYKILELKKWMEKQITREKIPEKWYIVNKIPKTDRGKISRKVVEQYCLKKYGG